MRRYNKRSILYAIGAGTLLLALMAFSAISLGVIHICGRWFRWGAFSFWEILGVSIVSFMGFIAVRGWQRRRRAAEGISVSISRQLRQAVEKRAAQKRAVETCSIDERPRNWRDLYEQMSEEERNEMKAMMRKYCAEQTARPRTAGADEPSGPCSDSSRPPSL